MTEPDGPPRLREAFVPKTPEQMLERLRARIADIRSGKPMQLSLEFEGPGHIGFIMRSATDMEAVGGWLIELAAIRATAESKGEE